jgi:hypothetical protein
MGRCGSADSCTTRFFTNLPFVVMRSRDTMPLNTGDTRIVKSGCRTLL